MKQCPSEISGAQVLLYTPIDGRHTHTGNTRQIVNGAVLGAASGLAICQYPGDQEVYLFGCDAHWASQSDTWHQCVADAKDQAEFEYAGTAATWQVPSGVKGTLSGPA